MRWRSSFQQMPICVLITHITSTLHANPLINLMWSRISPRLSFVRWQIIWCLIYWNFLFPFGGNTTNKHTEEIKTYDYVDIFVIESKTEDKLGIKEAEKNCVDWNNFGALKLYFNYETGLSNRYYIGLWCNWMGIKTTSLP